MVVVEIKIHNVLRGLVGEEVEIELGEEGGTLMEVLKRLCHGQEEAGKWLFNGEEVSGDLIILINGIGMNFLGYGDAKVKDEDKILILPAIAGG
jgi:molybdopterin converting factor small subunit